MASIPLARLTGDKTPLSDDSLTALRVAVRGDVLLPDAPGFAASASVWNGMITRSPALVVRPTGTADVIAALGFAREHQILLSIKGGGHNIAGTAVAEHGMMLDMSRLRGVLVDPKARRALVQPGALLGDVDRETQVHGLATVLGFVSETGVAGLTLGGGYGYLTRKYGWTVDSLREVEIVTAEGRVRRAAPDENEELFWALRGGGGNFGVVTSFTFELYPVGPMVTGGLIVWDATDAKEVLEFYRDLTARAPRELTLALTLRKAPPAPFLPSTFHGKPMIAIVACHVGTAEQAKRDLAELKGFGKPIVDLISEKPYAVQQKMLDATQPRGVPYYWKSEYVADLSDEFLSLTASWSAKITSPMSQFVLFHLAGALPELEHMGGAVGNRDAKYMCGIAASYPPGDPKAAEHLDWVRACWNEVRPLGTGGVYINFQTEEEGEDRVRAAYGSNFERLARVKQSVDPENLFRVNRNISPRSV